MTDDGRQPSHPGTLLDSETLREWIGDQRWYGLKSGRLTGAEVVEAAPLDGSRYLTLVQTRTLTGAHEIYQLMLAPRDGSREQLAAGERFSAHAALEDPRCALLVLERILEDADLDTDDGRFSFRHIEHAYVPGPRASARTMDAQQSNSSIVIDDTVVLKLFRKVESGINPELEMLRFLTARHFENIAPLHGWYEYEGRSLASTLGIAQQFIAAGRDGWNLMLDQVTAAPDALLEPLAELGRVTARMHTTLASDPTDPAFSPEDPISESMSLLNASIDEEIERLFMRLPDNELTAAIYGRGDDVRSRLAARSQIVAGGKNIRTHGDYHLGQTLRTPGGWVILDFEGEPGRPLSERRHKQSPLRDVAGMLRSFAYVASAVTIQRGEPAPAGFEERARGAFLDAYFDEINPALLPGGQAAIDNLLAIFELEKAIYELRYELNNRPDWVGIPAAGISRLVEQT